MTIFLTGASGLLGHALAKVFLQNQWKVHASVHNRQPTSNQLCIHKMDLSKPGEIENALRESRPDAIVNAAALSIPAACREEPELSHAINVALPNTLSKLTENLGARLIHFSTDMVFDGTAGSYSEEDTTNPSNIYGEHKLQAEQVVLSNSPNSCVLRLPILMGNSPAGTRSIHESLWQAWKEGDVASLFEDEWRQPTSVTNVATLTAELLKKPKICGLFHWAGATRLSRWEIGKQIAKTLSVSESLLQQTRAIDDPRFKDRPLDLTMNCSKLSALVQTKPASLKNQLEEIVIPTT